MRHGLVQRIGAAALAMALVAACSTEPFEVPPPKDVVAALPPGPELSGRLGPFDYDPRPRALSVCYSDLLNEPRQVMQLAQELCPNEGLIERVDEDFFWNACALFQPVRATFLCTPGRPPPPKFQ